MDIKDKKWAILLPQHTQDRLFPEAKGTFAKGEIIAYTAWNVIALKKI